MADELSITVPGGNTLPVAENALTPSLRASLRERMDAAASARKQAEEIKTQPLGVTAQAGELIDPTPPLNLHSQAPVDQVAQFSAAVQAVTPTADPNVTQAIQDVIGQVNRATATAREKLKALEGPLSAATADQGAAQEIAAQADVHIASLAMDEIMQSAQAGVMYEQVQTNLKKRKEYSIGQQQIELASMIARRDDPSTFWADKTTQGKVGFVLGALMMGLGSGLARTPNRALEHIDNLVNQDLQRKQRQVDFTREIHKTELDGIEDEVAYFHAQKAARLEAVQRNIALLIAKTGNEKAKANLEAVRAGVRIEQAKEQRAAAERMVGIEIDSASMKLKGLGMLQEQERTSIALQDRREQRMSQLFIPGYGVAANQQTHAKVYDFITSADAVADGLAHHLDSTFSVWGQLSPEERKGRMAQLSLLLGPLAKIQGLGVLQKHDMEYVQTIVGSGQITDLVTLKGRIGAILRDIKERGNEMVQRAGMPAFNDSTPLVQRMRAIQDPDVRRRVFGEQDYSDTKIE